MQTNGIVYNLLDLLLRRKNERSRGATGFGKKCILQI